MRIGLPRALLYYRYGKFWEEFLKGLGAEVVVSKKTDEELLNKGVSCVSSEVCLPIKIVAGHFLELADRVDAIFFPRIVWLGDKLYACPKMIGIVDIARMLIGNRVRLITPAIKGDFTRAHLKAGLLINPNPIKVWRSWKRSKVQKVQVKTSFPAERGLLRAGIASPSARNDLQVKQIPQPKPNKVGLIGHFYNIGDEFISRAIVETFNRYGYQIVTKEELPLDVLLCKEGFAGKIRWVYERELYNAFRYLLANTAERVAGFCVIVSMGCGPDSLVAEFMREEAQKQGVPFLLLVIDEHTGTAGLVTRVEAFIELLCRQHRTPAKGKS